MSARPAGPAPEPPPEAPADAIPLTIRGGFAGEAAVTEDLEAASALLRDVAQELRDVDKALLIAQYAYEDAYPRALPAVAPYIWDAKDATADARSGPGGATRLESEADDVGDRLLQVARGYREAELGANRGASALVFMGRMFRDLVDTRVWTGRVVAAGAWKLTAPGLFATLGGRDVVGDAIMPDGGPPTAGYLNGTTVEAFTRAARQAGVYESMRIALASLARIIDLRAGEPLLVDVERHEHGAVAPPRSLEDLGDLLVLADDTNPREVVIETVVGEDGVQRHVVVVPGMLDGVGSNPEIFDGASNFEAVAGERADSTDMVIAAMRDAGIGPDDEVLMVGHSQGGMVAATIAASGMFNTQGLVTVGSPAGAIPLPEHIHALHINNKDDPVHGFDGTSPPLGPNQVVVWADVRGAADRELAEGSRTLVGAHEASTYRSVLAAVDRSTATSEGISPAHFTDQVGAFLGGTSADRATYSQVHEPQPSPEPETGVSPCASPAPHS